jgi:hypothetical protein
VFVYNVGRLSLLYHLEAALQNQVDLITVSSLQRDIQLPSESDFRKAVFEERIKLYDAA